MGFAGQVFAARVAIGLAVPSPQALQRTGTVLSQQIGEMGRRIELAATKGGMSGYTNKLTRMNMLATKSSETVQNVISQRMKNHLNRMNRITDQGLQKSVTSAKSNIMRLKAVLSEPLGKKLTAGMSDASGMQNVIKFGQNVASMTSTEQDKAITGVQERIQVTESLYSREVQIHNARKDMTSTDYQDNKKRLDKMYEEIQLDKRLLGALKQRVRTARELNDAYKSVGERIDELYAKTLGTIDVIRNKFNSALRNSVAILTALGYKLNQNTQELMQFERELLNANSVFGLTNDMLFEVGNTVVEFGNEFGIATQNGAAGLYQLASAGLEAEEAMKVLPHTLKLSMAVQGDHNTISKLTAQTIFGFGMEMSDAAIVTDKFAYAIQKSLIEYQDLSSAVKFALPFFTSTGQSLDQLLGALQILTNRALEAGIAGRGLRQALAEFAESAMDAEAGFRKMGVEILNAQGEMLQLSEIAAQFAKAVGPETISNTELLTTLIQDLNVRGATAFIHLVQASDEFTQAVEDTTNAGGQLDQMVRIQNESLTAQMQILQTNIFSIFALRDAAYEGTDYINGFHKAVIDFVDSLRDLIIEGEGADQKLTAFGRNIQEKSIAAIEGFQEVTMNLIDAFERLMDMNLQYYFKLLLIPLKVMAGAIKWLGDTGLLKWVLGWKALQMLNIPALLFSMAAGMKAVYYANAASTGGAGMLHGIGASGMAPGFMGYGPGQGNVPLLKQYKTGGGNIGYLGKEGKKFWGKGAQGKAMKSFGAQTMKKGGLKMGGRALGMLVPGLGLAMTAWMLKDIYDYATASQTGGYLTPMAAGGMATGGSPYLVGEQGPELFMPGTSGQLLNNGQTNSVMGSPITLKNVSIGIDSFGGLA